MKNRSGKSKRIKLDMTNFLRNVQSAIYQYEQEEIARIESAYMVFEVINVKQMPGKHVNVKGSYAEKNDYGNWDCFLTLHHLYSN